MGRLILITNPGSSSRKYALFEDDEFLAALHFEFEDKKIICTLKDAKDEKKRVSVNIRSLSETVPHIEKILTAEGYLAEGQEIAVILARTAAPGEYFTKDHIVDDECLEQLEVAKKRAPLHIPVVAKEIEHFVKSFPDTPVIAMSDSAFHAGKPELMKYYAIDKDLADKAEIKRYGFHGLSVGFVVEYLKNIDALPERLIVCHIGSGSSVTAVLDGVSLDTSMGYSPLEGLMMSTRCGSIDVAAALAVKRALKLEDDEALEKYLNKEAGLLGVSGCSDDMREINSRMADGDTKARLAYDLFIYRIQTAIGQMAMSLGGVDAIVFTATIGERGYEMRESVCKKLGHLGFELDEVANDGLKIDSGYVNLATRMSKPIYVVRTDESAEMIRRALAIIK